MKLRCVGLDGMFCRIELEKTATIAELKTKISELEGIPVENIRGISRGRGLIDDRTLESYNIEENQIVHIVLRYTEDYPRDEPADHTDYLPLEVTEKEEISPNLEVELEKKDVSLIFPRLPSFNIIANVFSYVGYLQKVIAILN